MRTISRGAAAALTALLFLSGAAPAQDVSGQPILIPPQSSVFNQNSMNLPSAPMVSGSDIVRGADGTSCQSAVSSGGPYVDVGVLQNQDFYARDSAAFYGRVVIPIGRRAKRVDCTRLYKLEIERMRMELELLRMGTNMGETLAARAPVDEAPAPPPAGGVTIGGTVRGGAVRTEPETRALPAGEKGPDRAFFAQAGAFQSEDRAMLRLVEAFAAVGDREGAVLPLTLSGKTLFRALLGPMTLHEARAACRMIPGDCFVAER